jgi:hypothetical protein
MGLGSGIRKKPIPDPGPGVKKAPDPRSGPATLEKSSLIFTPPFVALVGCGY